MVSESASHCENEHRVLSHLAPRQDSATTKTVQQNPADTLLRASNLVELLFAYRGSAAARLRPEAHCTGTVARARTSCEDAFVGL